MVKASVTAAVRWRDGVFLDGPNLWCDAVAREVCFVSSAALVRQKHRGRLIATPTTLALLGAKPGVHLAVPPNTKFALGRFSVELFSTGSGLGAAGMRVDFGKHTVVYAGAVQPASVGVLGHGDAAVRSCDQLVIYAPAALAHKKLLDPAAAHQKLAAWVEKQKRAATIAGIIVNDAMHGIEVLLSLTGYRVSASPAIALLAKRAKSILPNLVQPKTRLGTGTEVFLALASGQGQLEALHARGAALRRFAPQAGRNGFATSQSASLADAVAWVAASKAKRVFVVGPAANTLAAAIGRHAQTLGPPEQMSLF